MKTPSKHARRDIASALILAVGIFVSIVAITTTTGIAVWGPIVLFVVVFLAFIRWTISLQHEDQEREHHGRHEPGEADPVSTRTTWETPVFSGPRWKVKPSTKKLVFRQRKTR